MDTIDLSNSTSYYRQFAFFTRKFFYKFNWLSRKAAQDLAQEVLVQAYLAADGRPTKALLWTIAKRRGADTCAKHQRRMRLLEQAASWGSLARRFPAAAVGHEEREEEERRPNTAFGVISYYSIRAAEGPEKLLLAKESFETPRRTPLSPALEEIISLMRDEGLTDAHEIAARLGISEVTARQRISRLKRSVSIDGQSPP